MSELSPNSLPELLWRALQEEKLKSEALRGEIKHLKEITQKLSNFVDQDEEYKINNLLKHMNKIEHEKEEIAKTVAHEEVQIKQLENTLDLLRKEKVDLENQLEKEQEYIINKLQKQLNELEHQKKEVELQLDSSKSQLFSLKQENFVLNEKVKREEQQLAQMTSERSKLQNDLEMDSERQFNDAIGQKGKGVFRTRRPRSVSVPNSVMASQPLLQVKTPRNAKVLKEGSLKKKLKDGNWKRHYCLLLSTNELRLYDDETAGVLTTATPIEIINIDTVIMVSKLEELHLFSMDSHEAAEEWVTIFQELKPQN